MTLMMEVQRNRKTAGIDWSTFYTWLRRIRSEVKGWPRTGTRGHQIRLKRLTKKEKRRDDIKYYIQLVSRYFHNVETELFYTSITRIFIMWESDFFFTPVSHEFLYRGNQNFLYISIT